MNALAKLCFLSKCSDLHPHLWYYLLQLPPVDYTVLKNIFINFRSDDMKKGPIKDLLELGWKSKTYYVILIVMNSY